MDLGMSPAAGPPGVRVIPDTARISLAAPGVEGIGVLSGIAGIGFNYHLSNSDLISGATKVDATGTSAAEVCSGVFRYGMVANQ